MLITTFFSCNKIEVKKEQPVNSTDWNLFEQKLRYFIADMKAYNSIASKSVSVLSANEITVDSARFYLETSMRYQFARYNENTNVVYNFDHEYEVPTTVSGLVTLEDVAELYENIVSDLSEDYDLISDEEKQLLDIRITYPDRDETPSFVLTGTFGAVNGSPAHSEQGWTFTDYFDGTGILAWHWDDVTPLVKTGVNTYSNTPSGGITQGLSGFMHFKKLFKHNSFINLFTGQTTQALWIVDNTPYGIN